MSNAAFPALRLRRTRAAAWSRALFAETLLTPADLIWPLFIAEGQGVEEPIASLPGVSRWSVDRLGEKAREARDLGIPCIALFPNTPRELRTDDAREALNPTTSSAAPSRRRRTPRPRSRSAHRRRARSLYRARP
jgi:porphobilinogen synthase